MGFFSRIFSSFSKSRKLSEISDRVSKNKDNLKSGNIYDHMDNKSWVVEQTLDIAMKTEHLIDLIDHYDTDREELKKIFESLESGGAGQIVRGHYVPSSYLAFFATLNFVLETRSSLIGESKDREETVMICNRLVKYFENNETGSII